MFVISNKRLTVLAVLTLIFFSASFDLSAQAKNAPNIKLKKTAANIVTDGKIDTAEWLKAIEFPLVGGGKILLIYDGIFLQVGLKGLNKGWCHLYLTNDEGKTIRVLHASAALGSATYRRLENNLWRPQNSFEWNLRETTLNAALQKKLDQYLTENGWKANNNNVGSEIEFSIRIENSKLKKYKVAAVFTSDGKNLQFFPNTLSEDALNSKLIYGTTPNNLNFEINSWANLILK